jgi:SM-20-related protein
VTAAPAAIRNEGQALDIEGLQRTSLIPEPFPHLILPGFVKGPARAALARDFPTIDKPGSFPVGDLRFGPAFADFIAELEGPALRAAFAEKFAIDLASRPTMITVRGQARAADGRIHTDSAT